MLSSLALLATSLALAAAGDINRQSIIFNENTPDVFYCPQVHQTLIYKVHITLPSSRNLVYFRCLL